MRRLQPLIEWGQRLSLDYQRNRTSLAAGGLAYFVALSIAPAALAFGAFAGLFLDPAEVRSALENLVARAPGTISGAQGAIDSLVNLVEGASASTFTITTIVSVLIAVYAASKVVFGLRMAMNTTFGLIETRGGLIERAISAVITLVGLVASVVIVVILTVLPRVLSWLGVDGFSLSTGSWFLDWFIVVALVYLAVRWVMHHAPNHGSPVPWTSPGVGLATAGIVAATIGVGIYARYSASLGAAVLLFGTAIVILLWLYLSFVALLWGAIIEADRQRSAASAEDSESD
ncbi:MAG: YihY/virulence factor BrkB family protein [Actinomycetes bacterium]